MTMPGYQTYSPQTGPQRKGMAIASLVLGLVGLPTLLLCGTGMLLALVGLVLGIIAAARGTARGMAVAGIVSSVVTLVIGAVAIIWILGKAAECGDRVRYPTDDARQRCVEREFPFTRDSVTTP